MLVEHGYREVDVLNMPLDKLDLCAGSISRRIVRERTMMVVDTAQAIAGVFGEKNSLSKYLDALKEVYHGQ